MESVRESVESGEYHGPSCIFLPHRTVIRQIIKANVKFSKNDSLDKFLLRFGLVDRYEWYLANQDQIYNKYQLHKVKT